MDIKEAHYIISELENRLDVNSFIFRGVMVWPYLKTSIYLKMLGVINHKRKSKVNTDKSSHSSYKKWGKYFRNLILTCSHLFNKSRVCILSPGKHANIVIANELYNRSTYCINSYLLENNGKPAFNIEYDRDESFLSSRRFFPVVDFDFIFNIYNAVCIYLIKKNLLDKEGGLGFVEEINRELKRFSVPFLLNENNIYWELRRVFWLSALFRFVFRLKRTKKLILICFYNYISISACKAANDLGIETIEYQHGIQNKYQPMYNTWMNIPNEGYSMLPRVFAVWSKFNHDNVSTWASLSSSQEVRLVGNGFSTVYDKLSSQITPYISEPDGCSRRILVSLQSKSYFFKDIVKTISLAPKDWLWIFKEHPNHTIDSLPDIDLSSLKTKPNVVWLSVGNVYDLLPAVDIHATAFSTVAFDALEFNVPTIFFDEVSKSCFGKLLIECDLFFYADSADLIVEKIKSALSSSFVDSKGVYDKFDGEKLLSGM